MKQYKAVPAPKNFSVGKDDSKAAFVSFAGILNREATDGWEYHSMETITITEKPGCLQRAVPIQYRMLIFVRNR